MKIALLFAGISNKPWYKLSEEDKVLRDRWELTVSNVENTQRKRPLGIGGDTIIDVESFDNVRITTDTESGSMNIRPMLDEKYKHIGPICITLPVKRAFSEYNKRSYQIG